MKRKRLIDIMQTLYRRNGNVWS